MNNQETNTEREIRIALPFFVEFVKFSSAFIAIVAFGLLTLRFASAAQ